ncbi:hypothetical protein AJ78_00403 [Emergomyces pasteurianus Ep9510]|uniref:Developmental regulatory protein wetA n=1 Tax=Emergomyces pasteurianus Ep9510 TaxID=1447872 RepID=A0A1J9QU05_9EURO|nr:hypothetical protein AJ78_00403 [Emergomyces pasteurianus Ep9510]
MQPLHDVTDKEAQEAQFSRGGNAIFDAGTPCKATGELQARNLRNDLLSFHPHQTLVMNDKQDCGPSHGYSGFGNPDPDFSVMFHDLKDPGLYISSQSSPLNHIYKNSPSSPGEGRHHGLTNVGESICKHGSHLGLMQSSGHANLAMAYQGPWPDRFQSFNIQAHNYRIPLPPTSSPRTGQLDNISHLDGQDNGLQNDHLDVESAYEHSTMGNHSQNTPMSAPCTAQNMRPIYVDLQRPITSTTPSHSPPNQHILRSQPSESPSKSSWNSESIDAPSFHYTAQELQTPDNHAWWHPSAVTNRDLQSYSRSPYQPVVMAPTSQRPPTHQGRALQRKSVMMKLEHSPDSGSAGEHPPSAPALSCPEHIARAPFATFAPTQDTISRTSPFREPNQRQYAPPPHSHPVSQADIKSPGPPSTSTNPTYRLPIAKPEIGPHNQQQHQRRNHIRKTSSHSTNSLRGMKGTPTTPNSAPNPTSKRPLGVSFVNFTPEDSQKLLTGVAPSGSSKTKARREQEAREKRRKLSEAALLAVRRAGGDVEAFEAVFC